MNFVLLNIEFIRINLTICACISTALKIFPFYFYIRYILFKIHKMFKLLLSELNLTNIQLFKHIISSNKNYFNHDLVQN